MKSLVFRKSMENVRKQREMKLVTTEGRRSHLVSQPNYHTVKWFLENLPANKMNKRNVTTNKQVCLGLSVLAINKIMMYEHRYDYAKREYGDKAKICHTHLDSFIIHVKYWVVYADFAEDVETGFNISIYEVDRLLAIGENKKSDRANARQIRWKNNERICRVKTKDVYTSDR